MAEYKRIILLVLVMTIVTAIATAVAIGVLYETAFERQRAQLIDAALGQARLMEAIAQFDREHSDYADGAEAATIAQIAAAHEMQPALEGTSELALGRREGDMITFLMRHRHALEGRPEPIPVESGLAEPMRRALAGESGSMVGIDYHGETVLAAYEPVKSLSLGIVAKIDLAEIRAPFIRAGVLVIGTAALLVGLGTAVFLRLTNPMVTALRRREEELELILASTGEGIFGMDAGGKCTFANDSAVKMLGYTSEADLLGRDMHELMHHSQADGSPRHKHECAVYQALRENRAVVREEETLWRADGSGFYAEYRAYPMRRNGVPIGAMVTFVDITESKARDRQLVHAQKLDVLGQLTGGIAHDFNNLLTIVLGNLRFLRDEPAIQADKETREMVEDALSAAQGGADLTHRLLAFSRKQELQPVTTDVNAFLRENQRFLQRVIGEGIALELAIADHPLTIRADPQQLHSAILNLAINAADAMKGDGRLAIATERQAATDAMGEPSAIVVIRVSDTGEGMDSELARQALEPFFTTKEPGKGSGLGLSMVYGFARQSGGDLRIHSDPGDGTTVSLSLPEADAEEASRADAVARPQSLPQAGGGNVLVVEDEPALRRFAERSLQSLGYRVVLAGDAAAALEILRRNDNIDVLFSDIVMPGAMDGRALAGWVTANRPEIAVLLTTGFSSEIPAEGDSAAEDFPILAKPYSREELRAFFAAADKPRRRSA